MRVCVLFTFTITNLMLTVKHSYNVRLKPHQRYEKAWRWYRKSSWRKSRLVANSSKAKNFLNEIYNLEMIVDTLRKLQLADTYVLKINIIIMLE